MKFEIGSEVFAEALGAVARLSPKRSTLPVLSCVLIEATDRLTVSGTDLETFMKLDVPARVLEQGSVAVPARMLLDVVKAMPGLLSCEADKRGLRVNAGKAVSTIRGMDAGDFPLFQAAGGGVDVAIPSGRFAGIVGNVAFSAADDEARPVLTGILIEAGDKLTMTATDGFRLATDELDIKSDAAKIVVPAKSLSNLAKAAHGDVRLSLEENRMWVSADGMDAFVQAVEGQYPDWRMLLPKECATRFSVEANALGDALRVAGLFADDRTGHVNLFVSENKVSVSGVSPTEGDGSGEADASVEGPGTDFGVNAAYLRDVVGAAKGGRLVFDLTDPSKPIKVRKAGCLAVWVVMPMFVAKKVEVYPKPEQNMEREAIEVVEEAEAES